MLLPALQLATEKETNYTFVNFVDLSTRADYMKCEEIHRTCLSHQYIKYVFPFYTQLLAIKNLNHTTKKAKKRKF